MHPKPIKQQQQPQITDSVDSYVKITDFEKYEDNPFVPNMIAQMEVKSQKKYLRSDEGNKSMVVVHDESQTPLAQAGFFEVQEVEENQFVKLFIRELASHKALTASGRNVLFYLMSLLKPGSDRVRVRVNEALDFLEYKTRRSYYQGIANLLEKEIIARTKYDDEFFVNPGVVFNGSRITLAKTYVKKQSETAKRLNFDNAQLDIFDYMDRPNFKAIKNQHERLSENDTE